MPWPREAATTSLRRWLSDFTHDARYELRALRRTPGVALVIVLTIGFGIGAATAIFSVLNAVLLRPLPYGDANRLVRIVERIPPRPVSLDSSQLETLLARSKTLAAAAVYTRASATLVRPGDVVRLDGAQVSPGMFLLLRTRPLLGETFATASGASDIVLSHAAWQRYFGGAPDIVGQVIRLEGQVRTVVGIMGPRFEFPDAQTQFWIPFLPPSSAPAPRLPVIARLNDGVSTDAAAAEMDALLSGPNQQPASGSSRFDVIRVQDELSAPVKPALTVLTGAVGFMLLIAWVNVTSLLLARTMARRQELGIRVALGASRERLVRQAVTGSAILACIGGAAGVGLTFGGIRLLHSLGTSLARRDLVPLVGVGIPRLEEVGVNTSVLLFAALMCVITGLVLALAPAIRQSRMPEAFARGERGLSLSGLTLFRRHRTLNVLVVAQITMAMILLVGGGLLIRSFARLSTVRTGYDPTNVLTFQVVVPPGTSEVTRVTFADNLLGRLRGVAGVRSAAYAQGLPMVQLLRETRLRTTPDLPATPPPPQAPGVANIRVVSLDFLSVMRIPVTAGRGFVDGDGQGQPQVMLVNQAMARSGFFTSDPVGTQVYAIGRAPWEIVGVVDDVRQFGLDADPGPQVFVDARQMPSSAGPALAGDRSTYFVVRTEENVVGLASNIRTSVRQLDAQATVDNMASMEQLVANSIIRPRLYATAMLTFAVVSVLLVAIGVFATMSYAVAQSTREIGIRMALGANRAGVLRLVLRQGIVLGIIGIALGVTAATGLTGYLRSMLFELTPLDATTFVVASLLLALIATVAALVPAHRATRVDPLVALKTE